MAFSANLLNGCKSPNGFYFNIQVKIVEKTDEVILIFTTE